jgi:serine/threonine protein kinase/tetratricopeptide (TPR) repeat protein
MGQSNHPEGLRRLGDFEIIREIGRGGMGIVYEARQVSLNRRVALKVLAGGLGLTPKAVQRFHREAEAAAKLHHTNIVPVYATGEQDGTHFYAMELIDGPSLDHVIRQMRQANEHPSPDLKNQQAKEAPRPPELEATGPYLAQSGSTQALSASSLSSDSHYFDTVARLIADVADALEHAHQNGVIHRDLKPSNLLLSQAGRLSINDFGLARMLEQPGMTMTGEFVGTPAYMSPEQITAGRIPLDHRTDIYSLGATLYELLTLRPPFRGQSREQVLAQIVQKEPPAPRRVDRRVPVDLETICLKCLEKDPDRRYQTAGALAGDLRRYVNRFAISARRVGPVQRLVKWARRRPALAAALACAAVAVGVAAFFALQAYQVEQQRLVEQAQAQQDLQRVQRERALENAVAAAMGGDLEKAEKAISEAEAYGASIAQVRMLRGMVAFYRGDFERARVDLEQAVKLDPDSVAARGMLAMAYLGFGDILRYVQTATELEEFPTRTAEDYLFKGYSKQWLGNGLQDLNEAVKRSHSPLARAIRADQRMLLAEDRADPEEAERVLADVQAAKESLADNPYVLSVSVCAHVVAANVYLEAGKPEKRQAALKEAERDAQALKPWDTLTFPFKSLWVYFDQTGQEPELFDLTRRAAENSEAPVFADRYAQALYRRGQTREALEVLNRRKWKTFLGDYFRVCILAELHPRDRRAAYEEIAKRYMPEHEGFAGYMVNLLCTLGYKDEAVAICRARVQQGLGAAAPKHNLDYWTEVISEHEFLKLMGQARLERFYGHYHVALVRLTKGDRAGAREHLRQAVQIRPILHYAADFSRSFLARMEKDPTWPPWVPMKTDEPKP